jgi:predicted amidohydrolase
MRIGIIQSSPIFGERIRNVAAALGLASDHEADLWVLPEFFATGYNFADHDEVERLSESIPDGPTVAALAHFASEHRCFLVAGIPERTSSGVYNSAVLVGPAGYVDTYRKIHLFGAEKKWFLPGDRPFAVHDIGPARVGIMICFDHLFPEAARTLALEGAEILAHPANLVLPDLAQQTMAVRALENGVYTATANRVGQESRSGTVLRYTGQSQIVAPNGKILVRLSPDQAEAAVVDVDIAEARDKSLTSRNDKLGDRRPTFYRLGGKKEDQANP